MKRAFLLMLLLYTVGCAAPGDPGRFVVAPTSGGPEFQSSSDLLASGLVSEAIGIAIKGRFFDAEARLRKARLLSPNDPIVTYNLAVVLGQQGHAEEALLLLERLRATQGNHPRYALAIADVYAGQGERGQARGELKSAFEIYAQAQNWSQAALVARSISNLAFADGSEQESLCYSYEAYFLDTTAGQLGYHASILVGLNQFKAADEYLGEQISLNPALGASPRVRLFRALARGGLEDFTGALTEIEAAQDLLTQDPELGAEVNVVWWLLKKQVPTGQQEADDDKLQESLDAVFPEVARLKEKPVYGMLRWPRRFRELLDAVEIDEIQN